MYSMSNYKSKSIVLSNVKSKSLVLSNDEDDDYTMYIAIATQ